MIQNLCSGLHQSGVEITLFGTGDSRIDGELVPAIDEALRLRPIPVIDPAAYYMKLLAQVAARAHEFDVIHNHHDYWMLPLTEMTDTPVLSTLHGRLDSPDISAAFFSYPKARFISISDSQRRPMPGLPWVRTIHHGMDFERLAFSEKPGEYLAFLGRIHPDKRPDWAIEIARQAGVPLKIAAKIEGKEGQAYFDEFVKPHIDGTSVEFLGEISESEKSDFLGKALALVFPIDWPEPFGLVVLEALACGTPVLARPFGSMPEILVNGVTGYCHTDIRELANAVPSLASIPRLGCREYVLEHFSLTRMTEEYIDVYRQLSDSRRPRVFANRPAQQAKGRFRRAVGHRRDFLHSLERAADGDSKAHVQGQPGVRRL